MRGSSGMKAAKILTAITMVLGAGCIVSAIVCISSMGVTYGVAPEFATILTYLYQINAFACVFMILLGWLVLFARRPRTGLVKASLWGILLLSVMTLTPFVTDTLVYLSGMGFVAGFRLVCAYLPFMCLIAQVIALMSTWDAPVHGAARDTNFVAALLAVFATILYLWEVFPTLLEATETFDRSQFLGIVLGMLALTCQSIALWAICATDQLMAQLLRRCDAVRALAYVEARKAQQARLDEDIEEAVTAEELRQQALEAATAAARTGGDAGTDELDPDQILDLARAAREETERSGTLDEYHPQDRYQGSQDGYAGAQERYRDSYEEPPDAYGSERDDYAAPAGENGAAFDEVVEDSDELEDMRSIRDQERVEMYQQRLNIYKGSSSAAKAPDDAQGPYGAAASGKGQAGSGRRIQRKPDASRTPEDRTEE